VPTAPDVQQGLYGDSAIDGGDVPYVEWHVVIRCANVRGTGSQAGGLHRSQRRLPRDVELPWVQLAGQARRDVQRLPKLRSGQYGRRDCVHVHGYWHGGHGSVDHRGNEPADHVYPESVRDPSGSGEGVFDLHRGRDPSLHRPVHERQHVHRGFGVQARLSR